MEIVIIFVCILLNGLLAGAEAAFIAVNKASLKQAAQKEAKTLLFLREHPEKTLSVIQIGITLVGTFAAAIGGAEAEAALTPWLIQTFGIRENVAEWVSIVLVVVVITYVGVVIGELVPKTLGLRRPMFFALKAAPFLSFLSKLIYPIVILLEKSTKAIIRIFPKEHIIEEKISDSGIQVNIVSAPNQQYAFNIAKLEKTTAADILLNWENVTFVDFEQSFLDVENIIIRSGHTRIPVVKDDIVVGILNSKEFIALQKASQSSDWTTIIRPILAISEDMPVLALLRLMQLRRMHMAIVYKNNTRIGIVTLEEILEEIVGDIFDEDDDGAIDRILNRF